MLAEMQVTGQRPASSGYVPQRSSRDGHQVVMDAHAHFQQAVIDGNVYIGANPQATPVTTQAGLSATTPALTLYNPVGSGINLVLWTVTLQVTTAPAAIVNFSLAFNAAASAAPTSLTTANIICANGISKLPTATCSRVATLAAAPVAYRYLFGISAASLVSTMNMIDNVDGAIVLSPGVCMSIQANAAAAIVASFTWEEVAI